jgi:UDP-GlcNAc:undecaprenyl-phosphate/decaprenyl-phosphate GlcNAc-1-phosphate transferase
MRTYLTALVLSFLVSLLLTPLVRWTALRYGVVDQAGREGRKIHQSDTPRLGGLAIVAAFYVPLVGLLFYETSVGSAFQAKPVIAYGLLGGGLAIAAVGFYDDLFGTGAWIKLSVQVAVAVLAVELGFRIERVDLPFLPLIELGAWAYPVTVIWIVGVVNAVNLIDGLDGLAAGVALFGLIPVLALSLLAGSTVLSLVCFALVGALLGFLVFNAHPARIFMGDSGSMFLGFVLALITVQSAHRAPATVAMLTPVLALSLPLMDTCLAMARRAWFGHAIFGADRNHIHHRLLRAGLSHRRTVWTMYLLAGTFAVMGLVASLYPEQMALLVLVSAVVLTAAILRRLGYLELDLATLAESLETRRRNRRLRHLVDYLGTRRETIRSLDEIDALARELGRAVEAEQVTLSLPGRPKMQPLQPANAYRPRLFGSDRTVLGEIVLVWPEGEDVMREAQPLIDAACVHLASALEGVSRRAAEGRPVPQAAPPVSPARAEPVLVRAVRAVRPSPAGGGTARRPT